MTATEAVPIFHSRMSKALRQVLGEAAKLLEHRGRAWKAAMDAIAQALNTEIAEASSVLAPSIGLANMQNQRNRASLDSMLETVGSDLRRQLNEFRVGWTAPPPKRWSERHPLAYAILLMGLGLVAGVVVQPATALLIADIFQKPRAELKASLGAMNMAGMSVSVTNSGELAGSYAATEITAQRGARIAKTYMVPVDAPMRVVMIPGKSSKLIELEPFSDTGWFWVRSDDKCTLNHVFVDNDGHYFSKESVVGCEEIAEYHNLILVLRHLRSNPKQPQRPTGTSTPSR